MPVATGENWIGEKINEIINQKHLSTEELGYVFNIAVDEEDEKNFE